MKFIDIYFDYKDRFNDYIIIYPVGTFYNILGCDTKIIHELMGYQIKKHVDIPKVGFPLTSLEKVIKKLTENKINYIILERVNGIIKINQKKRFKQNMYNKNFLDIENDNIKRERIMKLTDYISKNYESDKIQLIIENIEKLYE